MIQRILELRRYAACRLLLLALVSFGAGCVPQHNVRPLPDFVQAAIEPGDAVVVTTVSGETVELIVTEVTDRALSAGDRRILLAEIAELKKVAWERPPSPCGGEEKLGCSVPLLVSLASKEHAHYREVFYDACEQHDYCYRHGARTYGLTREHCDAEFRDNTKLACPEPKDSAFGTIMEVLSDSINSSFNCLRIANDFYMAARNFGEKHFRDADSTHCEYNGPP